RDDQIVSFKTLQRLEIFICGQIASLLSVFVGIDHQLFIGRKNARYSRTGGKTDVAVAEGRAANIESPEDVCQRTLVFLRQFEAMLLDQRRLDGSKVIVEHFRIRRDLIKSLKQ